MSADWHLLTRMGINAGYACARIESHQFDLECPINAVEVKWMHYAQVQQRSNDACTCSWSNHGVEMDCDIIKISPSHHNQHPSRVKLVRSIWTLFNPHRSASSANVSPNEVILSSPLKAEPADHRGASRTWRRYWIIGKSRLINPPGWRPAWNGIS